MATGNTSTNTIDGNAINEAHAPATATGTPSPTTDTAQDPQAIAGPVWGALTGNPGASATAIAEAAATPTPAARRALAALEKAGHATRTPGGHEGGKRAPDTWYPTTQAPGSDDATEKPGVEQSADGPPADAAGDDAIDTPDETPTREEPECATPDTQSTDTATEAPGAEDAGMDEAAVSEAQEALRALTVAASSACEALKAGDREEALRAVETIYSGSGKTRRLVRAAACGRPRTTSGKARSHPGELRAKVAAHLAAHPGKEFTPNEIGKAIGHSAGAIVNALDRLIALGQAIETCERPRRFTAVPDTSGGVDADSATAATA